MNLLRDPSRSHMVRSSNVPCTSAEDHIIYLIDKSYYHVDSYSSCYPSLMTVLAASFHPLMCAQCTKRQVYLCFHFLLSSFNSTVKRDWHRKRYERLYALSSERVIDGAKVDNRQTTWLFSWHAFDLWTIHGDSVSAKTKNLKYTGTSFTYITYYLNSILPLPIFKSTAPWRLLD
jgi:hypothetical protein